jgi:electron transport complex protein RnfE
MAGIAYGKIVRDGLWNNNQALVALLGLCPLLATTTSATNGLGMGIATTAVLLLSNITVSMIRRVVRPEVRIPVYVVVIASFVTIVELLMKAYFHELHKVLGIFVALIVVNCTILGRAEAFASKNPVRAAAVDGLSIGVGVTAALVALGGLRELVGQGTLFAQAHLMLGEWARLLELELGPGFHGALAAILPPGAFIGLGLLIALKNVIDKRAARRAEAGPVASPEPVKAG